MYPYILEGTKIHYLGEEAILFGEKDKYIVNKIETFMLEKIDGKKSKKNIIDEIAFELKSDDKKRIKDIFEKFVNSKAVLIKMSNTPKKHIVKRTGIKGKIVPLFMVLTLTNKCVMSCEHCFMSCNSHGNMSLSYDRLMHTLKYLKGKVHTIQLTGGEPMVYENFLDILDYCSDNFDTLIATSAVLINNDNIDHFKKVKKVQVSVYSDNPEEHDMITNLKGSFEATMKGIDMLVATNVPVAIATIVTRRNKDKLNAIIDLAIQHKVSFLSLGLLTPLGRAKELIDTLSLSNSEIEEMNKIISELIQKYKGKIIIEEWNRTRQKRDKCKDRGCFDCGGGLYSWSISEYGNIKPCLFVPDELFSIGCLEKESIEKILDKYSLEELAQGIKNWERVLNTEDSNLKEICPTIFNYYKKHCV